MAVVSWVAVVSRVGAVLVRLGAAVVALARAAVVALVEAAAEQSHRSAFLSAFGRPAAATQDTYSMAGQTGRYRS